MTAVDDFQVGDTVRLDGLYATVVRVYSRNGETRVTVRDQVRQRVSFRRIEQECVVTWLAVAKSAQKRVLMSEAEWQLRKLRNQLDSLTKDLRRACDQAGNDAAQARSLVEILREARLLAFFRLRQGCVPRMSPGPLMDALTAAGLPLEVAVAITAIRSEIEDAYRETIQALRVEVEKLRRLNTRKTSEETA